jgi:hypothetical protein
LLALPEANEVTLFRRLKAQRKQLLAAATAFTIAVAKGALDRQDEWTQDLQSAAFYVSDSQRY